MAELPELTPEQARRLIAFLDGKERILRDQMRAEEREALRIFRLRKAVSIASITGGRLERNEARAGWDIYEGDGSMIGFVGDADVFIGLIEHPERF